MPEKTVAIIQSNYIPWVGYFAIAAACDTFIVFEDVQYTKNDWRNRNRIEPKRSGSHVWLTVPVYHADSKQKFVEKIGMNCPLCTEGDVIVKKFKSRTFYGCSRYPDCKYTSSKNPLEKSEDSTESAEEN